MAIPGASDAGQENNARITKERSINDCRLSLRERTQLSRTERRRGDSNRSNGTKSGLIPIALYRPTASNTTVEFQRDGEPRNVTCISSCGILVE